MSSSVKVDTNAGLAGYGILAGATVVVGGALYLAGFKFSNAMNILLAVTCVLVGLLLWLMLTDKNKIVDFVKNQQLLALVASCLVAANVLMSAMQNIGVRSLMA